jgi:hypothetical protein
MAFELQTVVHLIQPWGEPVRDLEQLRAGIALAPAEVLFHHTVQYRLRDPAAEELPPDDLSAWVEGVVQDREAAEHLAFAVQTRNSSPETVRRALDEALGALPARRRGEHAAPEEGAFRFLSATTVPIPTGLAADDGQALVHALATADPGVWFFHVVQEPWFHEGHAPLLEWLTALGERRLADWLRDAGDPGLPLDRTRARLLRRWQRSRLARRVTDATAAPEDVRREAGRQAVARFMRRVKRAGETS